jgi:pyruvoyl-dependent arginine decarboxylase (PvlArgDC)
MVTTPKGRIPGYVDPVIDPDTGMVVEGGTRLPTGPKVVQAIPAGDPGSASITVNPQSQSPEYVAPDQPVDLLSDILAPDGSILPGVMDVIGSPETGRTSSAAPIFDIPQGGFPDPRVSPPQLTPEQVQRANENNAATQRRAQLMAQGMSANAAMMQAEREKIRARAARLGLVQ